VASIKLHTKIGSRISSILQSEVPYIQAEASPEISLPILHLPSEEGVITRTDGDVHKNRKQAPQQNPND